MIAKLLVLISDCLWLAKLGSYPMGNPVVPTIRNGTTHKPIIRLGRLVVSHTIEFPRVPFTTGPSRKSHRGPLTIRGRDRHLFDKIEVWRCQTDVATRTSSIHHLQRYIRGAVAEYEGLSESSESSPSSPNSPWSMNFEQPITTINPAQLQQTTSDSYNLPSHGASYPGPDSLANPSSHQTEARSSHVSPAQGLPTAHHRHSDSLSSWDSIPSNNNQTAPVSQNPHQPNSERRWDTQAGEVTRGASYEGDTQGSWHQYQHSSYATPTVPRPTASSSASTIEPHNSGSSSTHSQEAQSVHHEKEPQETSAMRPENNQLPMYPSTSLAGAQSLVGQHDSRSSNLSESSLRMQEAQHSSASITAARFNPNSDSEPSNSLTALVDVLQVTPEQLNAAAERLRRKNGAVRREFPPSETYNMPHGPEGGYHSAMSHHCCSSLVSERSPYFQSPDLQGHPRSCHSHHNQAPSPMYDPRAYREIATERYHHHPQNDRDTQWLPWNDSIRSSSSSWPSPSSASRSSNASSSWPPSPRSDEQRHVPLRNSPSVYLDRRGLGFENSHEIALRRENRYRPYARKLRGDHHLIDNAQSQAHSEEYYHFHPYHDPVASHQYPHPPVRNFNEVNVCRAYVVLSVIDNVPAPAAQLRTYGASLLCAVH
ncbi:hypothetical protein SISNIDRAFT_469443 [Sistotremastrum niveocremeum HHB9708]|uniref:Uncharacterized protein n=1 Tax=Sistotremastrum niveocremeum HHB9708 TaxID=1314777 RepID=A0A164Q8D2_9AGAM|nr:hypothetical protein SISNIDRAFT_469443 [Sistotremastrum niveocremeum HHB9708]